MTRFYFKTKIQFAKIGGTVNFDKILQKIQQRGQKLVKEANSILLKNNFDLTEDELSKKLEDRLIRSQNKLSESKSSVIELNRLTFEKVEQIFLKTGLKPMFPKYWFYDDLFKYPLIQISHLSDDKLKATPIAALCVMILKDVSEGTKIISEYVKTNAVFINEMPSNKWGLGLISQLTDLTCSYILGFNMGYNANSVLEKYSEEFKFGYEDGFKIRSQFIFQKLIEDNTADPFENEQNPIKISELIRVGYFEESNGSQNENT